MITAGLAGVGAGATFAGCAGGFVSPPPVERHDPITSNEYSYMLHGCTWSICFVHQIMFLGG